MAYQVLARKLRPKHFDALVGQDHVSTTLLNSLKNDRVPHALLFTGARGVGKTTAARIFAKSLRCKNAVNFVPCGECQDCLEIAEGRSIDVIEIDGASNNGVENVRELRESVGYMPSHGKYKVYIIDEVHMLSNSAFNALLKTLEEPPGHVVFIFATTEVQKIPVTILSRCQRYDFRRIPIKKIADYIATIVKQEGVEAESQALWLVAREAEGSMRDSLSLLDQVISFCGNKITHESVVEILGLTDRTLLSKTLNVLVERNAQACLDIAEKVFKLGYDPKQFAQDLLEHIRNLMIVKMSGKSRTDFLDLPDLEIDELIKVSQSLSDEDIHLLFDMTLKGVSDVMRAQDPRVVLEMLLLRMSQAPRLESIETLLNNSGADVQKKKSEKLNVQTAAPVVTPAPQVVMAPETWPALLDSIKKEKPLLGAKLEYASLEKTDTDRVTVFFRKEQEFFYNQVSQADVVKQLVDMLGKYWGKAYSVDVKLGAKNEGPLSPVETVVKKEENDHKTLMEKVENHPMVKQAKSVLKAKVTSVSKTGESS